MEAGQDAMGKASRSKQRLTPREKIAIQRAAEQRQQVRTRVSLTIGSVVAVVAIVVAFVVVKAVSSNKTASSGGTPTGTALSKIISQVTSVPVATLAAVGAGPSSGSERVSPPLPISGQPPLTSGGKPEIVYDGAEFCPYCAAERWAMVVALSRFGTFSNLGVTHSSTAVGEAFPDTKTLTFYKSSYSSPYLVFSPVEETDPNHNPLQSPTADQQKVIAKYNAKSFLPSSAGSIPFLDLGNKFLVSGASFSPQVLQGKSWSEIAAALSNPSSPIAQAVDGVANVLTADICKITGNKPASVCSAAPITSLNK